MSNLTNEQEVTRACDSSLQEERTEIDFDECTFIVTSHFKSVGAPTIDELMAEIIKDRILRRLERDENNVGM
jgi:hypothetical protein